MPPAKTYDDFFYDLPEAEQQLVRRLREVLLSTAPNFGEKISCGVPYYFLQTRVCFIWPASVKAGPKAGVWLGFCRGNLLSNEQQLLELNGRKEVTTITFFNVNEINENLLREILNEAILVDESCAKEKTGAVKQQHF